VLLGKLSEESAINQWFGSLGSSELDPSCSFCSRGKAEVETGVSTRSDSAACQKWRKGYVPLVPFILCSSEIMNSFLFGHGVPNLVTLAGGIVSSRALNGKFWWCTYSSKRSRTSWTRTRLRYTPQYLRGLCCLCGKGACRRYGRSKLSVE
jgi:hypothetical protein